MSVFSSASRALPGSSPHFRPSLPPPLAVIDAQQNGSLNHVLFQLSSFLPFHQLSGADRLAPQLRRQLHASACTGFNGTLAWLLTRHNCKQKHSAMPPHLASHLAPASTGMQPVASSSSGSQKLTKPCAYRASPPSSRLCCTSSKSPSPSASFHPHHVSVLHASQRDPLGDPLTSLSLH